MAYFTFSCTDFNLCFFSSLLLFISIFFILSHGYYSNQCDKLYCVHQSKVFQKSGWKNSDNMQQKVSARFSAWCGVFLMIRISGQPDRFLFLFRRLTDFFYLSKLTFVHLVCEVRRCHLEITYVHSIWLFWYCFIVASFYSSRWPINQKHNLRLVNFMLISVALV